MASYSSLVARKRLILPSKECVISAPVIAPAFPPVSLAADPMEITQASRGGLCLNVYLHVAPAGAVITHPANYVNFFVFLIFKKSLHQSDFEGYSCVKIRLDITGRESSW